MSSLKRAKKIFLAATALLVINFAANGQADLIGAMLIGYVLAGFYVASTAARLRSIVSMSQAAAKRQMLVGLGLRLLMIFIVLNVAVHISQRLFFATAACFMIFYVTALIGLVMTSYNQKLLDEADDDKKSL